MCKKESLWRGLTFVFAILLTIAITVGVVLEKYRTEVDSALHTRSEKMVTSNDNDTLWKSFTPPSDVLTADGKGDSVKLISKFIDLGRRQGSEGSVLLKNTNSVLPLASGSSVTLLGMHSHEMFLGASMGVSVAGSVISLEDALGGNKTDFNNEKRQANGQKLTATLTLTDYEFVGAGYKINPVMTAIYGSDAINPWTGTKGNVRKFNASSPKIPTLDNTIKLGYDPEEPSIEEITAVNADFKASFKEYKDAAIVVVGRPSGESNDYLPGAVAANTGASEPLELTTDEREIIKLATDNFEKVIVLVNATSTMEIEELKQNDKIDSIMWVGQPGSYGTLGIADVLCGRVSPSGALPDMYAAKNMSHPAMQNMGNFKFANANQITDRTGMMISPANYLIEAEGIYVGYRYYETRYNDIVNGVVGANSAAGKVASKGANWSYTDEVSYPFGYGQSYTTFTQTMAVPTIKTTAHGITMDFDVTVKNTGEKAGKSVVQIYGQAPYIKGGVEKSAIQLLAIGKTKELAKGASQTLKITADLQDLASYDNKINNNGGTKGAYILDGGKYMFAIGNGAHDALNNVLAKQGKKIANGMDYDGDATKAYEWSYGKVGNVDKTTFGVSKSNTAVENQLDYSDWNHYEGSSEVKYLSRSDWAATYPKSYKDLTASASLLKDLNGKYYEVKKTDDTSNIKFGDTSAETTFADMKGSSFEDPRWDDLMNKITLEEAMGVIACGGNKFRAIESIGFAPGSAKLTENAGNGVAYALGDRRVDAPWAFESTDNNAKYKYSVFASGPTVAASFNPDLYKESGEIVGLQALFVGLPILWGPGLNTHRSPYNGRNGEYYSEDGVLCGNIGMEYAIGALKYGMIAAPKHFAFNDQETARAGIAPFMTEQRAREVELRAFQIAVEATKYDTAEKDVGMLGLMTSFSKIGGVECTASYGLITGILKNEWGFKGYTVTDISDDFDIFAAVANSGLTGYDVRIGYADKGFSGYKNCADGVAVTPELYSKDANLQLKFKDATHNVLWAFTQTNFMNNYNSSTHFVWQMTWWRGVYIAAISVFAVLAAGGVAMYVLSIVKNKKKEEVK